MKKFLYPGIILCLLLITILSGCGGGGSTPPIIPTPIPSITPIHTPTLTSTATPHITPTRTPTPTPTHTPSPTPIPTPSPTPDPYTNIFNEGWENPAIPWIYIFNATRYNGNPHSGSYALKLLSDNGASYCTYDCHDGHIPGSNQYKYSFWIKGDDASNWVSIAVMFVSNSTGPISSLSQTYNINLSNTYTKIEHDSFPIPAGTDWVQFMFWSNNSGSGTVNVYVDDFSFGVK